jgi:transcriptional regulator with XRE-family HTH domain
MKHHHEDLAIELGLRLRRLRRAAGLSQHDVADMAGLDRTTIGLLERGKRGMQVYTLLVVAGALEERPSRILEGIEYIPGPPPPQPQGTWSFTPPQKRGHPGPAS